VRMAYGHALASLRAALDAGDLERQLGNQIIRPIFALRTVPSQ